MRSEALDLLNDLFYGIVGVIVTCIVFTIDTMPTYEEQLIEVIEPVEVFDYPTVDHLNNII